MRYGEQAYKVLKDDQLVGEGWILGPGPAEGTEYKVTMKCEEHERAEENIQTMQEAFDRPKKWISEIFGVEDASSYTIKLTFEERPGPPYSYKIAN